MPLTIDLIVEKYRNIKRAPRLVHQLRREGISEADQAAQVDRFRAGLIGMQRAEQIAAYVGLFGSHERSLALFTATLGEPADVFWRTFLEWWTACDGLWQLRKDILSAFRQRKTELSPIALMNPEDRAFYGSLPDRVTVLRGCSRRRVRGLPWTVDRERAEFFARGGRLGQQPDPVIARAEIAKVDIFFVSTNRVESEVVLDPYSIKCLRLESAS
jgi:hypothetical protein